MKIICIDGYYDSDAQADFYKLFEIEMMGEEII